VKAEFSNGVLMRDGWKCVVCYDPTAMSGELQAAHVVPLRGQLHAAGLLLLNAHRNGITLCLACFERGLWSIDPTDRRTIRVTHALKERCPEWVPRQGTPVHCDHQPFHLDWPSQQTLQVQYDFMQAQTEAQQLERLEDPVECPYCDRGYATHTSSYLIEHVRKHASPEGRKGILKDLHTPAYTPGPTPARPSQQAQPAKLQTPTHTPVWWWIKRRKAAKQATTAAQTSTPTQPQTK
jgi:hypothetical protein